MAAFGSRRCYFEGSDSIMTLWLSNHYTWFYLRLVILCVLHSLFNLRWRLPFGIRPYMTQRCITPCKRGYVNNFKVVYTLPSCVCGSAGWNLQGPRMLIFSTVNFIFLGDFTKKPFLFSLSSRLTSHIYDGVRYTHNWCKAKESRLGGALLPHRQSIASYGDFLSWSLCWMWE